MIKHHPNHDLLNAFVLGELPASMSAAVAMHNEMCPVCQQKVSNLTEQCAEQSFEQPNALSSDTSSASQVEHSEITFDFDSMIAKITESANIDAVIEKGPVDITVKNQTYRLPRALASMELSGWTNVGKLSRARLKLDEGDIHTSMLQIQPGGAVPHHTHKGYEVTVLLDGQFKDEMGEYGPEPFS
ncbi:cupin domain-containing protein [Thalassotalea aquiviva]|uniref:cupin domain-containing protein n=1 Tax=Thalassotalea aquiviva TaxID=3242415 RepID=UPI00352A2B07